jgi:phosphopantothenoylcysteine decarboxylase/phosphopantothenate--cysteine ligase
MSRRLRCLITAGPTREHLDPVRFLSNGSSGRMGYALAEAAAARGWRVDLVSGPVALRPPRGVNVYHVVSAGQMFERCEPLFGQCDLFLAVAAVADYRPKFFSPQKPAKSGRARQLILVPTIDILKILAARKQPEQIVVGFAAETHDLEARARRKLKEKMLDWIVANDVSRPRLGMNADDNAVLLLGRGGDQFAYGPAPKSAVASFILGKVAPASGQRGNSSL